ncbi:MAG: hypothetical protein Nk1A_7270 [Endomicrobiia bacterium]|nr:MAG: hypothetical protein Nk1A_7270 [Endomicrobiia bacterium]
MKINIDFKAEDLYLKKVRKYFNTHINERVAKSKPDILGGNDYPMIEEAIERVLPKLFTEYKKGKKKIEEVFRIKSQDWEFPSSYVCELLAKILIDSLKKDGHLARVLGDAKAKKLYEDSFSWIGEDITIYNPMGILSNCLRHLLETKHKQENVQLPPVDYVYNGLVINEMHKIGKHSKHEYNRMTNHTNFSFDNISIEMTGSLYKDIERLPKVLMYALRGIVFKNEQRTRYQNKLIRTSEFTVRDYLRDCCGNLKNVKRNRYKVGKRIKTDMDVLISTHVDLTKFPFKKPIKLEYCKFNIVESCSVINGKVVVEFTGKFVEYLSKFAYIMKFPMKTFSLSYNAFCLAYKYYLQKHIIEHETEKLRKNIWLSTEKVIESLESIPKYEDLKQKRLNQLIVTPIEKYLDDIVREGIFSSWEYCEAKGAKLHNADVTKTYNSYNKAYVKVTFPKEDQVPH